MKTLRDIFCRLSPSGMILPILFAVGGAIFIGISPIVVKLIKTGPIVTAFYRILFSLPFVWIWFYRDRKKTPTAAQSRPSRRQYLLLMLAGIFFAVELSLWYVSLTMTSVVNSTLLNNFGAFFVPLMIWALFSERPTLMYLLSAIMGLTGAALLSFEKLSISNATLWGDFFAICSAVCLSGYFITVKHLRSHFTTPTILWWSSATSCVILGVVALCFEDQLLPCTLLDCVAFLVLALFIHIGGQGLLAHAMGHLSASFLALAMLISPVISAFLAWSLFSETMTLTAMVGCAIVLLSLFFAQQQQPLPAPVTND